jgi:hypothetical protein
MSVQIAATMDGPTVAALLRDLTPLTIGLGDADQPDRWIEIHRPDRVTFVRGEGLRVDTTAKLGWTVAGVGIAFTIQALSVLFKPIIDAAAGRLNLVATIEEADLKNVPDVIDESIVSHVNERLAARPDALGWTFGETLAVRLAMPASMAPLDAFEMKAEDAAIEIGSDHLRFSLALPVRFTRSAEPHAA